MTQKIIFPFVLALGIAVLVGCGNNIPLRGTVTYSDDGSPLTGGTVIFESGGSVSRGEIGRDGTYVVGTLRSNDGIPPGTYTVYLINTERTEEVPIFGGEEGDFRDVTIQTVAPRYTSPTTSDLTVTVDRSTRTFDFQVERHQSR